MSKGARLAWTWLSLIVVAAGVTTALWLWGNDLPEPAQCLWLPAAALAILVSGNSHAFSSSLLACALFLEDLVIVALVFASGRAVWRCCRPRP